jgi:hypothetical protein
VIHMNHHFIVSECPFSRFWLKFPNCSKGLFPQAYQEYFVISLLYQIYVASI